MDSMQGLRRLLPVAAVLLTFWPAASAAVERFPDKLELVGLLRAGNFEELEARLTAYQEGFEADRVPEEIVEVAFFVFANSDPRLESSLAQWILLFPNSYAAPLARGVYYWHLAWRARGARYAQETSDLSFAEMRDYLALSDSDLDLAIRSNEKLSIAYAYRISIAMLDPRNRRQKQSILKAGLDAVPKSAVIRYRYLFALLPWWGGSLEKIDDFITVMKRNFPDEPAMGYLEGFHDFTVAEILEGRGEEEEAIPYYERALSKGEHWWYRLEAGQNFYFLQRYEKALEEFDKALELRPLAATVLNWRARAYRRLERFEEAFAGWDLALRLDPLNPAILRQRSFALADKKRYREAVEDLTTALEFGAYDERIYHSRGWIYLYKTKEYKKAAIDLKRATLLNPESAKYWYEYASALFYNLDCDIIAALKTYLRLCSAGQKCKAHGLKFAKTSLAHLATVDECSME